MLISSEVEAFVPSTDLDRARSFYEGKLGLRLVEDNGFALLFAGHNARIRVTRVGELTPVGSAVLGWVVADIEGEADDLASRGVPGVDFPDLEQDSRRIWTAPNGDRVAWFRDADGNTLSISQAGP